MRVLEMRNVHCALPRALQELERVGQARESRNGPVIVFPDPVTTVYAKPCERVMFWSERDANPAFHLYEALWMLAGRDDVFTGYTREQFEQSFEAHFRIDERHPVGTSGRVLFLMTLR